MDGLTTVCTHICRCLYERKCKFAFISKLYALLTAHGLEKNVSHIYYLLDLLSNYNLQNICTKEFPLLNILQNHQTVVSFIDHLYAMFHTST
jgi:hypothetical protein